MNKAVALVVFVTLFTKPVMLVDFVPAPGLLPLVLAVVLAFILWTVVAGKVRRQTLPVIFPITLGISALATLSLVYAIDPGLGFRQMASTFPLRPLFFLCVLWWLDSKDRIRVVMRTIFVCGALFAAHGLLQTFAARTGLITGAGDFGIFGRVLSTSTNIMSVVDPGARQLAFVFPRVQSFFSEPAFYLGFLNTCLFIGISLGLVAQGRAARMAYLFGALLIIAVAPLTMSTAGVFSMVVGLALFAVLARSVPNLRASVKYASVGGIISVAVLGVVALSTPLGDMVYRYTVLERFSGESGSVADRARGFGLAAKIIRENVLGGVGYGNELEASVQFVGYASAQYSSHLISFIQMGVLGFLLHLSLSVVVFITFLRSFKRLRSPRTEDAESLYLLLIGPFVAFVMLSAHGLLIPNAWWYIHWYVYVLAYALHSTIRAESPLTRVAR